MSDKCQSVPLTIWIVIALLSADVLLLGYSALLSDNRDVFSRWNQESAAPVPGGPGDESGEAVTTSSNARRTEPEGSEVGEGILVLQLADQLKETRAELRGLHAKLKIATSEIERLYSQMAISEENRGR